MKKLILVAFSFLILLSACSPKLSNLSGITQEFDQLALATNQKDWNKVLDYSYPKLFEVQPKEQVIALFEQMEAIGIAMRIEKHDISNVSKAIKSGDEIFAKAKLATTSKLEVSNPQLIEPMLAQFKSAYKGAQIEKLEDGLRISSTEDLYIIQNKKTRKNYFLQASPQVKAILHEVVPKEVFEHFN